jgi:hypothetical protein
MRMIESGFMLLLYTVRETGTVTTVTPAHEGVGDP